MKAQGIRNAAIGLLILLGTALAARAQVVGDVMQRVAQSLVRIEVRDADGQKLGFGSGFVVSTRGAVATNYHVIARGHSATVQYPDGRLFRVRGVIAMDARKDFAVLDTGAAGTRPARLADSSRLRVGEDLISIGHPRGLPATPARGMFQGWLTDGGVTMIQNSADSSPGSSGGPLANALGEVVGVVTGGVRETNGIYLAVPINDVRREMAGGMKTRWALPAVAVWQEARDRKQLKERLAKMFAVHRDPMGRFSLAYPRDWRVARKVASYADGSGTKDCTVFSPRDALLAEAIGHLTDGIRVCFDLPRPGHVWTSTDVERLSTLLAEDISTENPTFVITESRTISFDGEKAGVLTFVGQPPMSRTPEKTTWFFLARPRHRVTVELTSPTSRLERYSALYQGIVRTFSFPKGPKASARIEGLTRPPDAPNRLAVRFLVRGSRGQAGCLTVRRKAELIPLPGASALTRTSRGSGWGSRSYYDFTPRYDAASFSNFRVEAPRLRVFRGTTRTQIEVWGASCEVVAQGRGGRPLASTEKLESSLAKWTLPGTRAGR